MPAALPYIVGGATILNTLNRPKLPPAPPVLTMDQARGQAQQMLNPLFDEQLQNTMQQVATANMRRGFYGQPVGDAIAQSAAADIGTRREQAVGQLAAQMQGMSQEQAMQHAQLAYQAQMAQHQNMMNTLGTAQQLFPLQWGQFFGGPNTNLWQNVGRVINAGWANQNQNNTPTSLRTDGFAASMAPSATPTAPTATQPQMSPLASSVAPSLTTGQSWVNPYGR